MSWVVFFAPHTDDEVLGMAGHIIDAKRRRHQVLVVLVTDNLPSPRGRALFPDHDTVSERRKEWRAACHAMGVDAMQEWNLCEAEMLREPFAMTDLIESHMRGCVEQFEPVALHTTMGIEDTPPVLANPQSLVSHGLCAKALARLKANGFRHIPMFVHAVYVYARPRAERLAPRTFMMKNYHLVRKREALSCYHPGADSIGYGFRSVPELFAGADEDPVEYFQEL